MKVVSLNIEFLRNFIKLIKYRSFSDLAKDLSLSQSTLSHQISQLENELKVKLIDRTTRTFNITEEGKIFLKYAEKIIDLYDSCQQELEKYREEGGEDIIITASTLPGSHFLPKYIAKFRNKFPNANFKITINNSKKSIDLLKREMADFAGIGSFMDYYQEDFDLIKIGEDNLHFISSPHHKLLESNKDSVKFADIIKFPFILREKGSGTRDIVKQQFKEYQQLSIKLEINDNDSIISAVSDSNYISILSEHIARKAESAGLIKILKVEKYPTIAKRDIFFIKLKNKKLSKLKKKFWEYLKL